MRDHHWAVLDVQQADLLPTREALQGLVVAPVTNVGVALALNVFGREAEAAVAQAVAQSF